jgi:predicted metal-dependent hydrolase
MNAEGGDRMLASRDPWIEAVETFQEGRYLETHRAFESLWRAAAGRDRDFYQGWVLLAAALFHRDRGNLEGTRRCFERAARRWGALPPVYRSFNISDGIQAVECLLDKEWARPDLTALLGDRDGRDSLRRVNRS